MSDINKNSSPTRNAGMASSGADSGKSSATSENSANSANSNAEAERRGVSCSFWQGEENQASPQTPPESATTGASDAASPSRAGEAPTDASTHASANAPENCAAAQTDKHGATDDNTTDEDTADENAAGEKSMGLLDHLNELRQRIVRCLIAAAIGFGICWGFVDQLFNIITRPLLAVLPAGTHAQYTTLPEAFFTRMEIAFVAGLFIASPAIFYQIWAFVAPGLYDEEKKYILPIAFLSAIFFIAGGFFCYFIVFPFAFNFFISYSTPDVVMTPKISDYLSFVLKLIFAFGLIFEMPIFTLFLSRLGILTAAMMRRARKYAIVVIFILAAILTPPDVISQLLMACPMLILYELSIGVAAIFGRKPQPKEE